MKTEICTFCNGEGVVSGFANDRQICEICKGKGRYAIPEKRIVTKIPDAILNKDINNRMDAQQLPEPEKVMIDETSAQTTVISQDMVKKVVPAQKEEEQVKLCMKIYMELTSKLKGEKTKKIIDEIFQKYLDMV